MKTAITLFTLVASTVAQGYFGVISARSASPVHLLSLNANGGKFYLGGSPSSYCPPNLGETCNGLPGNYTTFAGGEGALFLAVVVPGGQQVYVAPDGAMSYTMPHSAFKPEGSIIDGWNKTDGEGLGHLAFKHGLIACPCPVEENKPRQVFAALPGLTFSPDCLGFSALTSNATQPGAWEY